MSENAAQQHADSLYQQLDAGAEQVDGRILLQIAAHDDKKQAWAALKPLLIHIRYVEAEVQWHKSKKAFLKQLLTDEFAEAFIRDMDVLMMFDRKQFTVSRLEPYWLNSPTLAAKIDWSAVVKFEKMCRLLGNPTGYLHANWFNRHYLLKKSLTVGTHDRKKTITVNHGGQSHHINTLLKSASDPEGMYHVVQWQKLTPLMSVSQMKKFIHSPTTSYHESELGNVYATLATTQHRYSPLKKADANQEELYTITDTFAVLQHSFSSQGLKYREQLVAKLLNVLRLQVATHEQMRTALVSLQLIPDPSNPDAARVEPADIRAVMHHLTVTHHPATRQVPARNEFTDKWMRKYEKLVAECGLLDYLCLGYQVQLKRLTPAAVFRSPVLQIGPGRHAKTDRTSTAVLSREHAYQFLMETGAMQSWLKQEHPQHNYADLPTDWVFRLLLPQEIKDADARAHRGQLFPINWMGLDFVRRTYAPLPSWAILAA